MPKRISVKGRGLGAYFPGEDMPTAPVEAADSNQPRETVADPLSQSAPPPAEPTTTRQAERQTRVAPREPRPQTAASHVGSASERISEPAYVNAAFRFTHRELEALDDAVHEIKKKYGARLSKKDVVRLSLASLLADYEANGDDSTLGQYARSGKQPGS